MKVLMKTIYAGTAGTSDAGKPSPDISKEEAQSLVDAGHAEFIAASSTAKETAAGSSGAETAADREAAKKEAARIEAEQAAALEEAEKKCKSPEEVQAALDMLDTDNDDDWTAGGKPAMDRIKDLTGSTTIVRGDVDEMFPEFSREAAIAADEEAVAAAAADNSKNKKPKSNGL